MRSLILQILAWLLLAAIAAATLSPIGLRPHSGFSPNIERLAAFVAVGALFAVAYPRHIWVVIAIVAGATIAFELLQFAIPSRHGRLLDLAVKLGGGGIGVALGWMLSRLLPGQAVG